MSSGAMPSCAHAVAVVGHVAVGVPHEAAQLVAPAARASSPARATATRADRRAVRRPPWSSSSASRRTAADSRSNRAGATAARGASRDERPLASRKVRSVDGDCGLKRYSTSALPMSTKLRATAFTGALSRNDLPARRGLEERLDLLVRVALGVRGHHDERLPVVVAAAIREQILEDLARAQDEAGLVVLQVHPERAVEHAR